MRGRFLLGWPRPLTRPIFVSRMLTRDLFAVANLLVSTSQDGDIPYSRNLKTDTRRFILKLFSFVKMLNCLTAWITSCKAYVRVVGINNTQNTVNWITDIASVVDNRCLRYAVHMVSTTIQLTAIRCRTIVENRNHPLP